MWDECTSVLRENLHNLFVLRNSVRILPIMAWTLYLLPVPGRETFSRWVASPYCGMRLSLRFVTFSHVKDLWLFLRCGIVWFFLAETIFWSLLFCTEPWNGSFIAFFLGYHYRSVRFREVVLSITVPYSWLRSSTTLIPFFVYTEEQGFFGKVFWAFLHHAPSKL